MSMIVRFGAAAFFVAAVAAPAQAVTVTTYTFENITHNDATNAALGEEQLLVEVCSVDGNTHQVDFRFLNSGTSAIESVYFDDGTLLGMASITYSSGVKFSQGGSPPDLPGGESIDPKFEVTKGFLADAASPPPKNGVSDDEWLTIRFDLIDGKTYADTIAALDAGTDLRIGVHVIAFANGGSESFINTPRPSTEEPPPDNPPPAVPEPTSIALGALGVASLAVGRGRRR